MVNEKLWIPIEAIQGIAGGGGGHIQQDDKWTFHYEILSHANKMIELNDSEHDRACAVFQLNRAVEFREKLLNSYYHFRRMPGFEGKKQHEVMSDINIIRPILKKNLDKIRNRVMHVADMPAPDLKTCRELAEFTWYFLKVTDPYVRTVLDSFVINGKTNDFGEECCEIYVSPADWKFRILADCPAKRIHEEKSEDTFGVEIEHITDTDQEGIRVLKGSVFDLNGHQKVFLSAYFDAYY